MSFGKNPHVAKAQAAEQKAEDASDAIAKAAAYRDAAHQWDRAAGKEQPGKKRAEYEANAEKNRARADGDETGDDDGEQESSAPKGTLLN